MEQTKNIFDILHIEEAEKHGLHGHVRVSIKNNETGEVSLWEESDNIIPISGYQWILMKMFGLHLDSPHDPATNLYENLAKDTTLAIPDLNNDNMLRIGTKPSAYNKMIGEIAAEHIVQGFMVGDGGAKEDMISTMNTDYSFVKLRNPIPFQETEEAHLDASIANKYLGDLRLSTSGVQKGHAYYIKKFDEKPQIFHSWYKDGQSWNELDPVTEDALGPNPSIMHKTNRIESYVQCRLSLDANDCMAYFTKESQNRTPRINELGLVAFDTIKGQRSTLEAVENDLIIPFLKLVFDKDNNISFETKNEVKTSIKEYAAAILLVLSEIQDGESTVSITEYGNTKMNAFMEVLTRITNFTNDDFTFVKLTEVKNDLVSDTTISVEALYDLNDKLQVVNSKYSKILAESEFDELTCDEAERIKLITCYTFASIPLEENTSIIFDYRIYAN